MHACMHHVFSVRRIAWQLVSSMLSSPVAPWSRNTDLSCKHIYAYVCTLLYYAILHYAIVYCDIA